MLVFLTVMALIAILIITGEVVFLKVLQEIRIETTEIKTQIREILTKELLANLYTIDKLQKKIEKLEK